MSIREWWENRRAKADAAEIKRVQDEAVETAAEREHSRGDIARRGGEASIDDVNRLGDYPR
jgi:hypothetical protein